jgi:hypothetical protein
MAARLFGIFVFGTNSSVIYRFVTDDLCSHLKQCFQARGYKLHENDDVHREVTFIDSFPIQRVSA